MPASVAEAYMLAIGTALPIIGESFAPPFVGMIQLDGFDWQLRPPKLEQSGSGSSSDTDAAEDGESERAEAPPFDGRSLIERVIRTMRDTRLDQRRREEEVRRHIQRATEEHDRQRESADRVNSEGGDEAEAEAETEKPELIFKFTKNADISTSQLLSQMANGQPLKEVHITLFHRSLHAPMTLLVSFKTVRLTSYSIECDAEEAMSDVKETWNATYKSVKFMYQNRPPLGLPYSIASTVAIATSQGRIKEFQMKVRDRDNPDEEW